MQLFSFELLISLIYLKSVNSYILLVEEWRMQLYPFNFYLWNRLKCFEEKYQWIVCYADPFSNGTWSLWTEWSSTYIHHRGDEDACMFVVTEAGMTHAPSVTLHCYRAIMLAALSATKGLTQIWMDLCNHRFVSYEDLFIQPSQKRSYVFARARQFLQREWR